MTNQSDQCAKLKSKDRISVFNYGLATELILVVGVACFFSLLFVAKLTDLTRIFLKNSVISLDLSRISYFPWTDISENITAAYLMANNYEIFEQFVMNHMPGVPALLAVVLSLFGAQAAGNETYNSYFILSATTSILFQALLIYFATKELLKKPKTFSVVFVIVYLSIYGIYFDFAVPMSESMLVACVYVATAHLLSCYSTKRLDGAWISLLLGSLLVFLSNMIGLTVAFYWILYCFCLVALELRNSLILPKKNVNSNNLRPYGTLIIICLISLIIVAELANQFNLNNWWYWNIEFNKQINRPDTLNNFQLVMVNLITHISVPLTGIIKGEPSIITLVLIGYTSYRISLSKNIKMPYIFLVSVVMYVSFFWRFSSGYKTFPVVGFLLALIFYSIKTNPDRSQEYPKNKKYITLCVSFLVLILGSILLFKIEFTKKSASPNFEDIGICPLKSDIVQGCKCLVSDTWGPQFFLQHNVKPCNGYFPSVPPPFFRVDSLEKKFIDDYKNGLIAVNVHTPEFTPFFNDSMRKLLASGKCFKISGVSQICYID